MYTRIVVAADDKSAIVHRSLFKIRVRNERKGVPESLLLLVGVCRWSAVPFSLHGAQQEKGCTRIVVATDRRVPLSSSFVVTLFFTKYAGAEEDVGK